MLFNTIDFAVFLPIVFILYWWASKYNVKYQNALVVLASYVFYGWWDTRFLLLIAFSTLVDYAVGRQLENEENNKRRKLLLSVSIGVNIGFLAAFKYYNFFLDNFKVIFSFFGSEINASSLEWILPVGISFYTFQTLSYSIDVYKKRLEPTKDLIAFSAFVSFFPQLVAGPIERATNLLPQFYQIRSFDYRKGVDGLRQILWGLFKKMVIADNCGEFANQIFNNSTDYSGSTLLLGAVFFAFQIYGDFSGYSDIAIGISRLFGFDLKKNFAYPYFSRDIAEFWRRWHISLSTWFRDYLYIPLGGSKGGRFKKIRNTFIIFLVSGFWHGANWTFIAWGFVNALYFLPLLLLKKNRENLDIIPTNSIFPPFRDVLNIGITFLMTVLAWIFFRAENISHALQIQNEIFSASMFSIPELLSRKMLLLLIFLFLFQVIEWIGREREYAIEVLFLDSSRMVRWSFYYAIVLAIFLFNGEQQQFIYFQF